MLAEAVGRKRRPVRLMGVGVRLLEAQAARQLRLFDDEVDTTRLTLPGTGDNASTQA